MEAVRKLIKLANDEPLDFEGWKLASKAEAEVVVTEHRIINLEADLKESLRLLDSFVTVTYTAETILDANNLLKKLKGAK